MIRAATIADATALGAVHVRAWQEAYRGQMPDAYLDALVPDERAQLWRETLTRSDEDRLVLVAEAEQDEVCGFAVLGPEAGHGPGGELYALNVDPSVWGRGIGRRLLVAARDHLLDLGHQAASLWVLPTNGRARTLYESDGWRTDGSSRVETLLGVTVPEIRYRRELQAVS